MRGFLKKNRVIMLVTFIAAVAIVASVSTGLPRKDATAAAARISDKWIGKPSPEFTLKTLDGKKIALADEPRSVWVLDFWAVWCGPCKRLSPHLQTLHTRYASRGVSVVGVNVGDSPSAISNYAKDNKLTYTMAVGDMKTVDAFGVYAFPTVVIIDAKGVIRDVYVGYLPGWEQKMENTIKQILED
ncbi:MAG: TlpA disulfide reductase family protein [Firmicutes bacterium]|nr:TlpA disulfide reductase family protein [Bacillota bacterium]